jgi:hypothetical protein
MSERGLVIYVMNRNGNLEEAVNHNPNQRQNVTRVFHQGQHYERVNRM